MLLSAVNQRLLARHDQDRGPPAVARMATPRVQARRASLGVMVQRPFPARAWHQAASRKQAQAVEVDDGAAPVSVLIIRSGGSP